MGLVMRCYHDNEYIFRFKQTSSVFAVKVEPSASCWVMSVVFSGHGLGFSKRILFPRGILDNMHFDAGKAYYIGDFYANVTINSESGAHGHLWKLEDLHNHYESTTAELIAQYPQLARVPSVNQLHLSAPQLTEP